MRHYFKASALAALCLLSLHAYPYGKGHIQIEYDWSDPSLLKATYIIQHPDKQLVLEKGCFPFAPSGNEWHASPPVREGDQWVYRIYSQRHLDLSKQGSVQLLDGPCHLTLAKKKGDGWRYRARIVVDVDQTVQPDQTSREIAPEALDAIADAASKVPGVDRYLEGEGEPREEIRNWLGQVTSAVATSVEEATSYAKSYVNLLGSTVTVTLRYPGTVMVSTTGQQDELTGRVWTSFRAIDALDGMSLDVETHEPGLTSRVPLWIPAAAVGLFVCLLLLRRIKRK